MDQTLHSLEFEASLVVNYAATSRAAARTQADERPPATELPPSHSAASIGATFSLTSDGDAEVPVRQQHRVVWEPGRFWRQDTFFQNNTSLSVIFSEKSAEMYSKMMGLMTSAPRFRWQAHGRVNPTKVRYLEEVYPIVPPAFPEREWLATTTAVEFLGRAADRVHLRRTSFATAFLQPFESGGIVWPGLDEYAFVRDREYGFVLEYVGYEAGGAVGHLKIDDLRVNTPVSPGARSLPRHWYGKRRYGTNFG